MAKRDRVSISFAVGPPPDLPPAPPRTVLLDASRWNQHITRSPDGHIGNADSVDASLSVRRSDCQSWVSREEIDQHGNRTNRR